MKKFYPLICLLLMPLTNFAQIGTTFTDSQNVKYSITSVSPNEVEVIRNSDNKPTGDINLTDVVYNNESYSVTSIGRSAFNGCRSLTSITIPESVTSIGSFAFYFCTSLTSITIPDKVTSIDRYAFYYCTSLTSATIPESVTSIGQSAFYVCRSLTSVNALGKTPATLEQNAFGIIGAGAELTVPLGSKTDYDSSSWSTYFDNIIEPTTLSNTSNYFDDLILFKDSGEIKANINNVSIEVYTVEGKKLANSNLKRGIYIVVAKNREGQTHRQKVLY